MNIGDVVVEGSGDIYNLMYCQWIVINNNHRIDDGNHPLCCLIVGVSDINRGVTWLNFTENLRLVQERAPESRLAELLYGS